MVPIGPSDSFGRNEWRQKSPLFRFCRSKKINNQTQSLFFKLPTEIRTTIYHLLFPETRRIHLKSRYFDGKRLAHVACVAEKAANPRAWVVDLLQECDYYHTWGAEHIACRENFATKFWRDGPAQKGSFFPRRVDRFDEVTGPFLPMMITCRRM